MKKIVIATHNAGKVKELAAALESTGWEMVSMATLGLPSPEENGVTFEDNADIKAAAAAAASGLWALADDSGLEVDALGGEPGVQTANYGGWRKLLEALEGVSPENRGAQFVCVLALHGDGHVWHFKGICRGTISREARGGEGFGYDPVFIPEGETQTFAEMDQARKTALSHRGMAIRKLLNWQKAQ